MARAKDRERVDQPADVTLEASIWSDPRFPMLASLTKLTHFDVRARVARVWSACTDRESTTLPEKHVDLFAELVGFGRAMVEVELAEQAEGGLYIRGTKGRIDWLKEVREKASAAGRASAKKRRDASNAGAPESRDLAGESPNPLTDGATDVQPDVQRTLEFDPTGVERTSSPGPGPGLGSKNQERERPSRGGKKASPLERHRAIALRLWSLQEQLRRESIPGSRPLAANDERLARIAERLEGGATEDECEHVLRVYAAESKASAKSATYFDGVSSWRPENFDRALGKPLGQVVVLHRETRSDAPRDPHAWLDKIPLPDREKGDAS